MYQSEEEKKAHGERIWNLHKIQDLYEKSKIDIFQFKDLIRKVIKKEHIFFAKLLSRHIDVREYSNDEISAILKELENNYGAID